MSEGRSYHVICNDIRIAVFDLSLSIKRHYEVRNNAVAMHVARCEGLIANLKYVLQTLGDKHGDQYISGLANSVESIKEAIVGANFHENEDEEQSRESLLVEIDFLHHTVQEIEREFGLRRVAHLHPLNDKEVRQKVWDLTGGRCTYCDCQLENGGTVGASFVIEHVVPRSCGGPDNIANYVPACASCNNSKGDRHVLQFIQTKMDRRRPPLTVVPLPVAASE